MFPHAVFPILMVHLSLRTNQNWVTCSFFQELYSHIDNNSGKQFEDMFLVKIASKGTSFIALADNSSACMQVDMKDTDSRFVGSQFIFRFDFQLKIFNNLLFYADSFVSIFACLDFS